MNAPKLIDGDIVIENNEWVWIDGDDELVQSIESTMQTRLDELDLAPGHGMRYDNLLGKEANPEAARSDIIEAVMQEPRVRSVPNVQITDDTTARTRSVFVTIEKEDGTPLPIGEVNFDAG
ncbi:hypothetical protein AWH48_11600 [Domibacillus aminovorans]|uniref:DUF2634 domain-containing protein n=1 Tax=Domibacillus aminovorans TaxID=29332 RepID=A0A177KLQ7_9BACI|nr:DUF2634 domain-containing protein [Domibacillus aminovorans]OAH53906.1 hypothetical protein AWH48_11600 [Domibacillus aminovorans]